MKKLFVLGIILLSIISVGFIGNKHEMDAEAAISSLKKDVPKNSKCALCNMVVYQKEYKMGVFSSQAIKKNGKVVYYDDIGCLLYDEVKNKTKNKKYVRDYKTLKWIKRRMRHTSRQTCILLWNGAYVSFASKSEAKKYIAKHKKFKIVKLSTIKKSAINRYKGQFTSEVKKKRLQQSQVNLQLYQV